MQGFSCGGQAISSDREVAVDLTAFDPGYQEIEAGACARLRSEFMRRLLPSPGR